MAHFNLYDAITAARSAAAVQYRLIFAEKPETVIHRGMRPVRACLDRLNWFQFDRIDQLTAEFRKGGIPLEFLNSAKAENPARIAAMQSDLAAAAAWELNRYGCILLRQLEPGVPA